MPSSSQDCFSRSLTQIPIRMVVPSLPQGGQVHQLGAENWKICRKREREKGGNKEKRWMTYISISIIIIKGATTLGESCPAEEDLANGLCTMQPSSNCGFLPFLHLTALHLVTSALVFPLSLDVYKRQAQTREVLSQLQRRWRNVWRKSNAR